jgi:hypothetical protein
MKLGTNNLGKVFGIWMIIEFILFLLVFIFTGSFSSDGVPMQFFTDIATSNGTTVWDAAIALFIVGTILNIVLMFLLAVIL